MDKHKTLVGALQANAFSDKCGNICFINGNSEEDYMSYKELYYNALAILYNLQLLGIEPGSELVFQIEDNKTTLCTFWACMLGKIIAVPVSVGKNDEHRSKLFKIWRILNKPYIITTQKFLSDFESYASENALDTTMSIMKEKSILVENAKKSEGMGTIVMPAPEEIAFIQFSSGSTGEPKGVVLTHSNLIANIYALQNSMEITNADSFLSWMPLTHDMGLIGFHLLPFTSNINQFIMPTALFIRHPTLWLKSVSKHRATILGSPNFGYNYFLKDFKPEIAINWDLSSVKIIANGAEPISTELCRRFLNEMGKYKLSQNCMNTVYGMAEACVGVTFTPIGKGFVSVKVKREALNIGDTVVELDEDSEGVTFVEVGYPINDCYVRICDDNDSTVAEHVIGHIQISGDNVTSGYYNNPQASALAKTEDGWLRTGDLGFMRNGQLVITGRMKDIIFINGQNYYPHDIERGVESISKFGLNEVAACSAYDEEQHKENIFIYVLYKKSLEQFIPLALKIKKLIMQGMGLEISEVIPIKHIPKTTSGKIQRYKLRQSHMSGQFQNIIKEIRELTESYSMNTTNVENKSETERILWEICSKVMGNKGIGVSDNFLEVGGNSIILTQIHKEIDIVFPDKLVVTDLFAYPTIARLASHIDNDRIIRLKPITMPRDYMNDINTNEEIKSFKFDVGGDSYKKLEQIAHEENIELHDMCLGLYVYLLSQVTGSKNVTLQTMIDDYNTVKPLSIDLNKYSNLNEIFRFREKENEYSQTSIHYTLEEINSVKMSKTENEIIPFFFRKDLIKSNSDLHSIYDLIIQIEVQKENIAIKYEYDCGKFKVDKLNEMFGNYIKLVNLLIEKYK